MFKMLLCSALVVTTVIAQEPIITEPEIVNASIEVVEPEKPTNELSFCCNPEGGCPGHMEPKQALLA